MKTTKIAILMTIVTIIAFAASASAYFSSQNIETKAERMVEIAGEAQNTVMELVTVVEANATVKQLITDADLDEQFYNNISLCVKQGTIVGGEEATEDGEGWTYLNDAEQALLAGEYQVAIDNAREALEIFREP
jgi:hypothetical protein